MEEAIIPHVAAEEPVAPAVDVPMRVVIPAVGVSAPIEAIGLQPGGKLDVPLNHGAAGWFHLGPRPGEEGTAVLDGHLDIAGQPGVFWTLKNIHIGDSIQVTDAEGVERVFRVTATKLYPVDSAPIQEIFGDRPGKHLHLITCAGKWDKRLNHYDQRLVVFAEMDDSSAVTINRSL